MEGDRNIYLVMCYDDELGEGYKSYWRVRRKLEKVCNGKMVIINTISDNDEWKK